MVAWRERTYRHVQRLILERGSLNAVAATMTPAPNSTATSEVAEEGRAARIGALNGQPDLCSAGSVNAQPR